MAVARRVQRQPTPARPWLQKAVAQLDQDRLEYLHGIADKMAFRSVEAAIRAALEIRQTGD